MNRFLIHNDQEIKGFFGNEEKNGYRWLSNFYGAKVYFNGRLFPTNEHAYQFAKLGKPLNERQEKQLVEIVYPEVFLMTAPEVKKWGGKINIREGWDKIKYDVMASINFDKYIRHLKLREKLIATGDRFLEESNSWHDNYWGNCYCDKCKSIDGFNALGKILMKIRNFWIDEKSS